MRVVASVRRFAAATVEGPVATLFAALLLAVGLAAGEARAQTGAQIPRAELERELIERFAAGRDTDELLRQIVSADRSDTELPLFPRASRAAAELESSLTTFRLRYASLQDLRGAAQTPAADRLRQQMEETAAALATLEAADLLMVERFAIVASQLERAAVSAQILARLDEARASYREAMDALLEPLESLDAALADDPDRRSRAALDQALQALDTAFEALERRSTPRLRPLLRASSLPYGRADLPPRAPRLEPTVVPSYQSAIEVEPEARDLASSPPEVPLSEPVLRLASSLAHDPVALFNFVRGQIATEWYSGAMKGAEGTLRQGRGSHLDQASLLIALLRASQIPARFVHGTIQLPVGQVAADLGLGDAGRVPEALQRAGVPFSTVIRGGRVAAVRVESSWVSAFVPYSNYRGAVVDLSGRSWIPLAPGIKSYATVEPTGILRQLEPPVEARVAAYLAAPQTLDPLTLLRQEITAHLEQTGAGSFEDQLGSRRVDQRDVSLLPSSLPFAVVAVTAEAPALVDADRQRVRFVVRQGPSELDPILLDATLPLARVAGRRLTLSYQPATVEDHKAVNAFGGLGTVPAFLIKLRPQIKVAGRPVAAAEGGPEVEMLSVGAPHRIEVELLGPSGVERLDQIVIAGSYLALGLGSPLVDPPAPEPAGGEEPPLDPADTEKLAARLLSQIALEYARRWDEAEATLAGLLDVAVVRPRPSVVLASNSMVIEEVLGLPSQLVFEGVNLDAARRSAEPFAAGSVPSPAAVERDWLRLSSLEGSALERFLFEEEFLVESISADRGLGLARQQGTPVIRLDGGNVDSQLPALAHPESVKQEIANQVRLGLEVEIPSQPVRLNSWEGSTWRAQDLASGAGGYFLVGGLAGGATTEPPGSWVLTELAQALAAPYADAPNRNPSDVTQLLKITGSERQDAEVGEVLRSPLIVLAIDEKSRPVAGVNVAFTVAAGGGALLGLGDTETQTLLATTDQFGMARARFRPGQITEDNPVFARRRSEDKFSSQALLNVIEAGVEGAFSSVVVVDRPFEVLAFPDEPLSLKRTDPARTAGRAGTWVDTINARVEDRFGNSVSNVELTFAVEPPEILCDPPPAMLENAVVFVNALGRDGAFAECSSPNPVLGDCGSNSLKRTTGVRGAGAGVILGNANGVRYRVRITANQVPDELTFPYTTTGGCGTGPELIFQTSQLVNERGGNLNAAPVGKEFPVPVPVTLLYSKPAFEVEQSVDEEGKTVFSIKYKPERQWIKTTGNVTYSVTNGGSATAPKLDDGTYSARITTGPASDFNRVSFQAKGVKMKVTRVNRDTGAVTEEEEMRDLGGQLPSVAGLDPIVRSFNPNPVPLNPVGVSVQQIEVQYDSRPALYEASRIEVDLLHDGTAVLSAVGDTRSAIGKAPLLRGFPFNLKDRFEAQVVVNRGSSVEARSEPRALPLKQKIFSNFRRQLSLAQDFDVVNRRLCATGSEFRFELTQPATVTLTFKSIVGRDTDGVPSTGGETVLIDEQAFPEGSHSRFITPNDLAPGSYVLELTGVSALDGHSETELGTAVNTLTSRSSLPVGHVLVKGIDLFDGRLVVSRSDLQVPGRGAPLELNRTYATGGRADGGPLGVGWSHSYLSKIIRTPCGEVIVAGGEGSGSRFVLEGGVFRPLRGHHGSLVFNPAENSFDFYTRSGTRFHYRFSKGQEWLLDFVSDPAGNLTRLTYERTGPDPKLVQVEDSGGRILSFQYQRRAFEFWLGNVITQVEGPEGFELSFEYDIRGNLIRATREGGIRGEAYEYGDLTGSRFDQRHTLSKVTDLVTGAVTEYRFERGAIGVQGNVSVASNFVSELVEPEGGVTRFEFDTVGLGSRAPPELETRLTDPRGKVTTYRLNQFGNPLRIEDPLGNVTAMTWAENDVLMLSRTDANGFTTSFEHDEHGNVTRERIEVTDFDGELHDYAVERTYFPATSFDPPFLKDRVRSVTNRNGVVTEFERDQQGRMIRERVLGTDFRVEHTYLDNGDRASTTDARGHTTSFTYDSFGNLASVTGPLGGVTRSEYDTRSRLVQRTDPLGRVTNFEYDGLDRVVRTVLPGADSVEINLFDDTARTVTQIDAEGNATVSRFDLEGRMVEQTDAVGCSQIFEYDAADNKILESNRWSDTTPRHDTLFTYDDAGRLAAQTEPLGRVTRRQYDGVGQLVRETVEDAADPSFAPRTSEFAYDGLRRRTTVRRLLAAVAVTRNAKYDGEGNVVLERDPLGRQTATVYDPFNQPIRETDAAGSDTLFEYDLAGNRIAAVDPLGRRRLRAYDELNRVIQETDALGQVKQFEYDAVGNVVREIDRRLHTVSHDYDSRNRRIRTRQQVDLGPSPPGLLVSEVTYDRVGKPIRLREANGNVILQTFDERNRLLTRADSLGSLGSFTYDCNDNIVEERDANGHLTRREYDDLERLVREDRPEGRSLVFAYDAAGNKISETDGEGHTTRFEYDTLDRRVRTVSPLAFSSERAFDLAGNVVSETDGRGNTRALEYDPLDRLIRITDPAPLGFVRQFSYDAVGNQTQEIDRRGIATLFAYDDENRRIRTQRAGVVTEEVEYDPAGNLRFRTDANGNITGFEYDERNLKIAENRPLAAIVRFTLDAAGDLVEERDPEGRLLRHTYDLRRRQTSSTNGAGDTTTFAYDGNGNQTLLERPAGGAWSSEYDGANRLVRVVDPLNNATGFTYDRSDNQTSITDANGHLTRFEYDPLNRLTARVLADDAREELAYDEKGNLTQVTDANGQVTTFVYDVLDRRTAASYSAPVRPLGDELQSIGWEYDANGSVVRVVETYSGGTGVRETTSVYDDFDRLLTVTGPEGKVVRYGYDANGNRTQLRDPDNVATLYAFDALNRVATVTQSQVGVTQYSYLRNSLLRRISYPNGSQSTYEYDLANRVSRIENRQGPTALISSFEYEYDANSNRVRQVEENGASEITSYEYDAADRLTVVGYPEKTASLSYDGVGNRLSEIETDPAGGLLLEKGFTYDVRDRLLTLDNLQDPSASVSYTYDANGNQISRTQGGDSLDFFYSTRDRLVEIQRQGTLQNRYLYDHQGLRVRKTASGEVVRYVYDDQSVLLQTDNAGNTLAKYDYGPDRLLALSHVNEGRQFYLFDALGSVVNLTRADGTIQTRLRYDPWGNPRATVGSSANPFGFTGHERDEDTGLYYFKARYYDPEIGRFLTQDPAAGEAGDPPTLHRYLYAKANPTRFVDPDGRQAEVLGLQLAQLSPEEREQFLEGQRQVALLIFETFRDVGIFLLETHEQLAYPDLVAFRETMATAEGTPEEIRQQAFEAAYKAAQNKETLGISGLIDTGIEFAQAEDKGDFAFEGVSNRTGGRNIGFGAGKISEGIEAGDERLIIEGGGQVLEGLGEGAQTTLEVISLGRVVARARPRAPAKGDDASASKSEVDSPADDAPSPRGRASDFAEGTDELVRGKGQRLAPRADLVRKSADDVNATFPSDYHPPYRPGTQVIEYTTTADDLFVRVHGPSNKARSWMMRREAIRGLTPQQIQSKYSLPEVPELVSNVEVPAGTRIRRGRVNPGYGGAGRSVQYELLERLPESAFTDTRPIQ